MKSYQHTTNNKNNSLGILIQHSFNRHQARHTSFYIGDFYYFRRTYDSFCLSPMAGVEYFAIDDYTLPILLGISYRWLFFNTFSLSVGFAIGPGFQMYGGNCEGVGLAGNSLFDIGVAF